MQPKEFIDGGYRDRVSRLSVLIVGVSLFFIVLLIRIYLLQIVDGDKYLQLSIRNRAALETVSAERGIIYDRHGEVIARNRPSYSLYVTPRNIPRPTNLFNQLTSFIDVNGYLIFDTSDIRSRIPPSRLRGPGLGTLDFTYTQEQLQRALLLLTDTLGTPYFSMEFLDSVFYSRDIHPFDIESVIDDNSYEFIVHRLANMRNSEGTPLFQEGELESRITAARRTPNRESNLAEDISIDFVSMIMERYGAFPGIIVKAESRREYPFGADIFHVLGYIGAIDQREFDSLQSFGYRRSDNIGKGGIELQYEHLLRGQDGWRYVERNVRGRRLGVVEDMPSLDPVPGKNLYLSIDAGMHRRIANSLDDSIRGAVVALNPQTGEIYALYSNPSFDANIFSYARNERGRSWVEAVHDERQPLLNKALHGSYPPGSTFKLVSFLSLFDSGIIRPEDNAAHSCRGSFQFGNRSFGCWLRTGHGSQNAYDAIKTSCNVFLYQLAPRIGAEGVNTYARQLMLEERAGIDLPGERGGYLSGREAHNRRFANRGPEWRWSDGLLMNLIIGQSQELTPLQMALMVGGIGNGEAVYRPHLLREVRYHDYSVDSQVVPSVVSRLDIKKSSIDAVKEGMFRAVNVQGGTGRRARLREVPVGGKSGSAQNFHPSGLTHALFTAAAPLDNPTIAVAVILENRGGGGAFAAPIVHEVLDYYFSETSEGRAVAENYSGWQQRGWRGE